MKELEHEIRYKGRVLRQLKREGTTAIYEVLSDGRGFLYGYEVIRIKRAPAEEKFGKLYPERELYPSTAKNSLDWGTIAWSWGRNQKEQAFRQFKGLVAQYGNAYPKENQTLEDEI
jgi:hypothetical protein